MAYNNYSFNLGEFERITETHVYFVRGPFSQWAYSPFVDEDGIKYINCEQYMMARKAIIFNDFETLSKIMNETNPKIIKDLGRLVKNYNEETWNAIRFEEVKRGNYFKFSQNENFKKMLLSTGDRQLVEAAWYDSVWGVGLRQEDDRILDENNWNGLNLLGKAVTAVREMIQ